MRIPEMKSIFVALGVMLFTSLSHAQATSGIRGVSFRTVSVSAGMGKLAIRDRAISSERYTGPLIHMSADWNDFGPEKGTHWGIRIRAGEDIANGLMTAEVAQLELDLDLLYSVYRTQILGRDAFVYLGPSTGTYLYLREQQIAFTGGTAGFAVSIYIETPLGIQSRLILPIGRRLQIEADLYLDVVSLGIRVPFSDDEDAAKLVHLGNSPEANLDLKLSYYVIGGLYLQLATQQDATKVGAWETDMLSGYSGITLGLGYDFCRKGNR